MLVHLGLLVVSLPSSPPGEQDVGSWVPFVQKADFRGKCLKPSLLQVLGEVQGPLSPLGMGEHLSGGWVGVPCSCGCSGLPGWSSFWSDPALGLSATLPASPVSYLRTSELYQCWRCKQAASSCSLSAVEPCWWGGN